MSERVLPPTSEAALLARAQAFAGLTIGELAARFDLAVPLEPRRGKGFAGALLELALGADAASRPLPDFTGLGIELKTIPVDQLGVPQESTFITVAPLRGQEGARWEDSFVRRKLARVLWIPVERASSQPLAARRIGWPVLWSPTTQEEVALRADWEELTTLISTGQLAAIDSRQGKWLQIRPKGADGKALVAGSDETGAPGMALPRGFYLRARFTRRVLAADGPG